MKRPCEECGEPTRETVTREINRRTRCGQGREDVPVIVHLCTDCQRSEP